VDSTTFSHFILFFSFFHVWYPQSFSTEGVDVAPE
jgi:hypothetical protein